DIFRVRITCFTLASGEFAGSDTVVIGEIEGGALRLVGITQTGMSAFLAAVHQIITASGTEQLCRPCYPLPVACADMNGDGREDCADKAILEILGPRQVTPFCPGDSNGDGCAGSEEDKVVCNPENPEMVRPCFATCRGDVNRDGYVDSADYNLVAEILGEEEWVVCPCQTCTDARESCPWDTDYDGDVDLVDLANANVDYECSASAAGCGPNNPACQ
ncbi:MAG: hypothetical protein JNK58_11680, partial [Phycisphaerae bacterium]|nr:hypothetical protein [Phycisphaerae bacterium]